MVVVIVAVALFVSPAAVAATNVDSGIERVEVEGPGDATVINGNQYIWANEPTNFQTTVRDFVEESNSYYQTYTIRLTRQPDSAYASAGETSLDVGRIRLGELATDDVTLTVPAGELEPGVHDLWASMYKQGPGADPRVSETKITVRVIKKTGDVDGDTLDNVDDVNGNTSLITADTDDDGLLDGRERHVFDTDPTSADTDDDGLNDPDEVSEVTNPNHSDTDSDASGDVSELLNGTLPTAEDTDLDRVPDPAEQELGTDPRDRDTDGDGLSDYTEIQRTNTNPLSVDTDVDGLEDAMEVRRFDTNPRLSDTDNDGISDAREVLIGTDPTSSPSNASTQIPDDTNTDRRAQLG